METTKNICCTKDKDLVDHSTVTRWLKKFYFGCNNLDDPARSSRPKIGNSKAVLQAKERNPASNPWRVSGKLAILKFTSFMTLAKASRVASKLWLMLPKYGKTLTHPHIY